MIAAASLLLAVVLIFAMSVAWFTNVSQTTGLQLQTQSWGFDINKIKIAEQGTKYEAAPGMNGYVPLTVDNGDGASAVSVTVSVNKQTMEEELRKRVFFYVEEPKTVRFETDGTAETMPVQYLGSDDRQGYRYLLAGGDSLILTQTYCSDAAFKWQWVYDMQGYYFRGRVSNTEVKVDEYLRPIEYDLNEAVFDQNETSQSYRRLLRVGGQTAAQFLKGVFDADGYYGSLKLLQDGSASPETYLTVDGRLYFRVETDDLGFGVWAYLCNYEEIRAATDFDNSLVAAGTADITATVRVSVANVETPRTEVTTAEELTRELHSSRNQTVTLKQDLTLTEPLTLSGETEAVLDLNGFTLNYAGEEADYSAFTVEEGSALTLLNGVLNGNGKGSDTAGDFQSIGVSVYGGRLLLSGITASDLDTAVFLDDHAAKTDSAVKISSCEFDTTSTGIALYGNGEETETPTRLLVRNTKITSGYIGISGQGTNKPNDQRWGTDVTLLDCKIEGYWAALYQPQQRSDTTISACELKGYTAVAIKGGTVRFYDSTIKGTGAHKEAAASSGGWTDTGDGVYVEATYGWSAAAVLCGGGNRVESTFGYAVELFGVDKKGPAKLLVEGGSLRGALAASRSNAIGTLTICKGTTENGVTKN